MGLNIENIINIGLEGLFYLLLLCFAVQLIFLVYHWFTYGSSKRLSLTALLIYLTGGAVFLLTFSIARTL